MQEDMARGGEIERNWVYLSGAWSAFSVVLLQSAIEIPKIALYLSTTVLGLQTAGLKRPTITVQCCEKVRGETVPGSTILLVVCTLKSFALPMSG